MTTFSKYFDICCSQCLCNEFTHDGNCFQSTIENFTRTIPGCTKFVLPLALIPIIMKFRNLNKNVFLQSARIFYDYFLGAYLVSGLGLTSICILRAIFGRFYYLTAVCYPSALGAFFASFFLADRANYHYAHGLSTIAVNVSLLRGDFYIFKWLRNSRLAITFTFMILNAILMHGLRETKTGNFYWITQPLKPKEEYHEFYETSPVMDKLSPIVRSQIKCCAHKDNCDSFIFEGMKKYLKLGIGLEMARSLIYNYHLILRNPLRIFEVFIGRLNWDLVMFLFGYVGIYRFVNCWGNRRNVYLREEVSQADNKLASFLCGMAFYLYPDFAIFSHAAINIIEIFWAINYEQIKSMMKWIPLEKINMIHLTFPIVFGYVLHTRATSPWLAPAILKKLMHLSTNYKDAEIITRYNKYTFGLTPQLIV